MSTSFPPIAIVGMGCVLPGALTPDALRTAVFDGRDLLGDAPVGRWGVPDRHVWRDPSDAGEGTWSRRGGYVRGFEDVWDAERFGDVGPTLDALDPLVRQVVWAAAQALDGCLADDARRARAGVVLGNLSFPTPSMASFSARSWLTRRAATDARWATIARHAGPEPDPRDRFMSGLPAALAARALGLGGRALALDAACASGLYALDIACRRLHEGSADLMLAGAVNRADDLFIHVGFCALGAISRTGLSRPFDRAADGLIPAEGAAMLALKRLDDAERDGERVLAVIRGIGLSNDGRGRSLLAPAVAGQVRAMRDAWESAGIDPASAQLVECHATGTPVGDATEIESMTHVFPSGQGLAIGSLKSNLGHLVTAAGTAGIIKVIGALQAQRLPPTLHVDAPIDGIEAAGYVPVASPSPWRDDVPRLAAVSAFGFGGNNAHVVLGEHVAGHGDMVFAPPTRVPVDIVGASVRAGAVRRVVDLSGADPVDARIGTVTVPLRGLSFPPRDLHDALGQQTLTLEVALEACRGLDLPPATGVWVGMGADTEVARYGARWRLPGWAEAAGVTVDDTDRDGFVGALSATGVVGTMPNIPANRLNRQLAAEASGYTVSSEELSGIDALDLAIDALQRGACDAAVVVAVDLCADDVHEEALRAVVGDVRVGDAAVALVLRRSGAGEALGRVSVGMPPADAPRPASGALAARVGYAHAASGLLDVAAALASLEPGGAAEVRIGSFTGQTASVSLVRGHAALPDPAAPEGPVLTLDAHLPCVTPRPHATAVGATPVARVPQIMAPAPPLPRFGAPAVAPSGHRDEPAPIARPVAPPTPVPTTDPRALAARAIAAHAEHVASLHTRFIEDQRAFDAQFTATHAAWLGGLGGARDTGGASAPVAVSSAQRESRREPPTPEPHAQTQAQSSSPTFPGPSFDRADLEVLSREPISSRFGPRFAVLDGYERVVRMPEPPMLLADRVLGIDAEPLSMGTGRIWTETDVVDDAWYMHHGVMPAGILIESGQADLLLISWLGADLGNRGDRVYRLLGCELTYHGGLPKPGETLRYTIDVVGHAKQGDVRLFFFRYDCAADDQPRLSVRHGQAGFFTEQELAESMGVLWSPEDEPPTPGASVAPPRAVTAHASFDRERLVAFSEGRVSDCFGDAFALAGTHTRTPRIAGGDMLLFDRITHCEANGGPAGRGYLRAELDITPDAWFFEGHFHNDPCMPGTLMFEGCLQTMAFWMASQGHTLERDGWRFEPAPDEPFTLLCRGQAIPSSKRLVYEVFVDELRLEPEPVLYAHILCTVDGLKAFFCRRMGLRLTPDVPLTTAYPTGRGAVYDWRCDAGLPARSPDDDGGPRRLPADAPARADAASYDDLVLDTRTMLASAWGTPRQAFGALYDAKPPGFRIPRLPGPPYLFMSHIARLDAEPGAMRPGGSLEAVFAWDDDTWFFHRGGPRAMPFAVLLEAALQPCGWLASWTGGAAVARGEVLFRNLDGDGLVHRSIPPGAGELRTQVTCTGVNRLGSTTIVSFDVRCLLGGSEVFTFETSFGFFPPEALAQQAGLPERSEHRDLLLRGGGTPLDLRDGVDVGGVPGLVHGAPLRMLDRVTGRWDDARGALGALRGEKLVDPSEWFFRAHFYRDPVQPGSLGIEALIQLAQIWMAESGQLAGMRSPEFEPIASGRRLVWRYRGQVTPKHQVIHTTARALQVEHDHGVVATFDGSLWCDGLRIYEVEGLSMRAVEKR